jgi:large subunit ribosomal protein L15
MRLNNLESIDKAHHRAKRVGRGPGSGHGKTSCRGHKGSLARSGGQRSPGFEGGQMPLVRRMPKRGFRNIFQKYEYAEVNITMLNLLSEENRIDIVVLKNRGIVKNRFSKLKILGNGDLGRKITVIADAFSAAAIEKIKAAGGEAIIRSE